MQAVAKANAEASAKAAAKSKAKPKAAPKKTPSSSATIKKRPASQTETETPSPPEPVQQQKKPKNKAQELKDKFKLEGLEDGHAKNEAAAGDEEPAEGEPSSRDRSKSNKFFSMMRSGGLPEAALAALKTADSRDKQTELINQVFVKSGSKLAANDNFELPNSYRKDRIMERADTATDAQSGFGRTIFKRKMNLNDGDLDECVRTGEVRYFKSGDVWLYAAVNVQISSGNSKKSVENLKGKEVDLAPEAAAAFASIFTSMEPEVKLQNNRDGTKGLCRLRVLVEPVRFLASLWQCACFQTDHVFLRSLFSQLFFVHFCFSFFFWVQ